MMSWQGRGRREENMGITNDELARKKEAEENVGITKEQARKGEERRTWG